VAWVITFDGEVYREVDLTIGEAETIEEGTSTNWNLINPVRSAKHARVILQTFLVSRKGLTIEEATEKVKALKVNDYVEMLSNEDKDASMPTTYENGVPHTADGPSTPG
jgi:hypothetical protein